MLRIFLIKINYLIGLQNFKPIAFEYISGRWLNMDSLQTGQCPLKKIAGVCSAMQGI